MRIAIVNDISGVAELLKRIVGINPLNQVVWIARNGAEAVELCAKDTPDLILMDIVMPVMDGVESTRRIMAATPCAILIVTGNMRASPIFEAMGYGALDAVDTPLYGGGAIEERAGPFLAKLASISRLIEDKRALRKVRPHHRPLRPGRRDRLVVFGASAGGPGALATILGGLPQDFAAAIVIVQHVDRQFAQGMASWLNDCTALCVRIAVENDHPTAGEVLLAATSDHLTLKTADDVGYTPDPVDYLYRPSIDVFFHSACRLWPGEVMGVLLSGMGRDGAIGLKALRDSGHYTIAQDRATSAVYGMPKAAATIQAAVDILPAAGIASKLIEVVAGSRALTGY